LPGKVSFYFPKSEKGILSGKGKMARGVFANPGLLMLDNRERKTPQAAGLHRISSSIQKQAWFKSRMLAVTFVKWWTGSDFDLSCIKRIVKVEIQTCPQFHCNPDLNQAVCKK